MKQNRQVIIIGGGPAGLTAAIYALRSRLDVLLIEKGVLGGQVMITDLVENYPGFTTPIKGTDLIKAMREQAERFGLLVEKDEVLSIEPGKTIKLLGKKSQYTSESLIIASGAASRRLGSKGEAAFIGRGVSYCATCDGPFFGDLDIAVVGGGDVAAEEAEYLTKFARKVYLIHRRGELRATKILQERLFTNSKVKIIWNSVVEEVIGDDFVEQVVLNNVLTNKTSSLDVSGLFVFVGTKPNTAFVGKSLDLDNSGFIKVDREMCTDAVGIFAAGDVTSGGVRQISAAVGDATVAAMNSEKYINYGR
jgi:thioredoxin reductase (NADPH)